MASEERMKELEDKYDGFKVLDSSGGKIGKVDDLFIDENDREEYLGVKMGFLGLKSTLIPMDAVSVNESEKTIEVSDSKDHVKDAPSFDDDEDITPEYEARIREHFNLGSSDESGDRSSYGAYSGDASQTETRGRGEGQESSSRSDDDYGEGVSDQSGSSLGDTGVTNDRFGEGSDGDRDEGSSGRGSDYGEGVTDQSGQPLGDTGVTNDRFGDSSDADRSERSSERRSDHGEGVSDQSGQPLGDTGISDDRFGGDSESSESSSEGSDEPMQREVTETETYKEGDRTKIRRRTRREEVEFEEGDS